MDINDIYMLPKQIRTMTEMADLLNAEQQEIDLFINLATAIEAQLCINTAIYSLNRYERQFALPYHQQSVEERRANILAKLNTRSSTTIKAVKELVIIITGTTSEVVEFFSEYRLEIHFISQVGVPLNMQDLIIAMDEMMPAHLAYSFVYRYRIWGELQEHTWGQLDSVSWDDLFQGGDAYEING